ncbi:MAG: M48 family metalloprotease [Acidobacteria bacterium]|nr:M48 family metalloprotease [Acidobacteriota bacterium]
METPRPVSLEPLPYLKALADHLAVEEARAWDWFSRELTGPEHAERMRLELLKATYRLDREDRPELYAAADRVRERLGVTATITLYQLQQGDSAALNASLFYIPGEAHVAFQGPVLEKLQGVELDAVLGHELGHFRLFEHWERRYRIAADLLNALLHDPASQPVHHESYRLFQLYKEIFCDRCSLAACGDLPAVVSALVKAETGLGAVSAESYLRQTEEIFAKGSPKTDGLSHPECFVRTWALKLWADGDTGVDAKVRLIIEGRPTLDGMDLLEQRHVAAMTRRLVDTLLAEPWFHGSEAVLAHARLFFDDFDPPPPPVSDAELAELATIEDEKLAQYFCYVLLDFAACDRDLEEPALAAAYLVSRRLGWENHFQSMACKELKLRKAQYDKLAVDAPDLLAKARRSGGEA